ncbi:MAG: hypothetical protein E7774_12210 [Bradyrhizobium sp.]|nr:MAG: hypothetical protein E7774_12210 [Bradyrhizobium sp.]
MVDTADALRAFFLAPERVPLAGGLTVHLIDHAEAVGPRRSLDGALVVETADGTLRRMTGAELAEFAELNPWVKRWRIEDEEVPSPF